MDTKIRVHSAPKTLITDPGVACCGTVDSVEAPLREAGMEVGIYDKAVPEPPMGSVHKIVDIAKEGEYDLIVGFGGGSAIDVAMVVAVLAPTDDRLKDYVGVDQAPTRACPSSPCPPRPAPAPKSPPSPSSATRS